jgi:hypothetical protein
MFSENTKPVDAASASLIASTGAQEGVQTHGFYTVDCVDAEGNLKWSETIKNLVVTSGKNFMLTQTFSGSAYTAAWFLGLVSGASTPTYAAGDTMASHGGWTEFIAYSNATRPAPVFNASSAGAISTTATSFNINGSGTVAGAFLTTNNTVNGTTGTLFSAGNFTGGNRTVASGDTLNVTYTLTLT